MDVAVIGVDNLNAVISIINVRLSDHRSIRWSVKNQEHVTHGEFSMLTTFDLQLQKLLLCLPVLWEKMTFL